MGSADFRKIGSIFLAAFIAVSIGVDSKSEMQLYGLVRTGESEKAIQFLQDTRRMSRTDAVKQVKKIASDLGLG